MATSNFAELNFQLQAERTRRYRHLNDSTRILPLHPWQVDYSIIIIIMQNIDFTSLHWCSWRVTQWMKFIGIIQPENE